MNGLRFGPVLGLFLLACGAGPSDPGDTYACAPSTDESGAEIIYALTLSERSRVIATVDDVSGDGVELEAGTYYLIVDTWVNGAGVPLPGPYRLERSIRRRRRRLRDRTRIEHRRQHPALGPITCR